MSLRSVQRGVFVPLAWAILALLACEGGGGSDGPPFTISGTMSIAASSASDSDVNDTLAPFADNGSAGQAQEIPNPVTLGGHLNLPGAFPPPPSDPERPTPVPGQTTAAGDTDDWFRVPMASGQRLRLQIAEDGSSNDLDLELRRAADESLVLPRRTGSARSEEIQVNETGTFLVRVIANSGFSNYTLSVGEPAAPAAAPAGAEFVPGQVIVRYREAAGSPVARAAEAGLRVAAGLASGHQLLDFREPADRSAALHGLDLAQENPQRQFAREAPGRTAADDEVLRQDTLRVLEALRARPDVKSADLNYVRRPSADPQDEFYDLQWHYPQINLPEAWDLVNPVVAPPEVVAVVDTGVVLGHPDLSPNLVPGYDFISDPVRARDGDGCDPDPDDPGDLATAARSSFHGTHVAGTVGAATSLQIGGGNQGVAGVAWNARVLPLRVLGVGGGTDFDIMRALRYAAGIEVGGCPGASAQPEPRARIVNMSLGGPGFNQGFQDLIDELRTTHEMIFVAAAGNDASTEPSYPAAYAGVVSVSAVGPTKELAPYSNRGGTIDVAAPGGDFSRDEDGDGFPDGVLSTLYDETTGEFVYAFYQGTSMATPHVAGVFALMLGIDPTITPETIDTWLAARPRLLTEDVGSSSFFGNGLIDAALAVNTALGGAALDPVLRIDPDSLNFGVLAGQLRLNASNGGDDSQTLTVQDIVVATDTGGSWLDVTPDTVDAEGLGRYQVTVDRSGLPDGIYTGSVRFESDRNDVTVSVILQVGDITQISPPNAGHQFVLLVDEDFITVQTVQAERVGGVYRFQFDGVEPGEYRIVAGTDADFDFLICDPGEACGAFPTTDSPALIRIDSDRSLSFVTGHSASLGAAAASASPADPDPPGYSRIPRR